MTPKRETRLRVVLKTTRWPSTPSPPLTSSPSLAASPSPFTTWPSTPAAPSLLLVASTYYFLHSYLHLFLPIFTSLYLFISLYISLPSLSSEGSIKIIVVDTAQGSNVKAHNGPVLSLAFDPKGKYLASAGGDATLIVSSPYPLSPLSFSFALPFAPSLSFFFLFPIVDLQ